MKENEYMKCPNCSAEVTSNQCEYCGTVIPTQTQPQSQQPINIVIQNTNNNTNTNGYIGSRIMYSSKSKGTAVFLCCLSFIGLGGLHRLYVGKKASGLAHLFTFGFFWIGTIIDLISLKNGTFVDSNGLPLK